MQFVSGSDGSAWLMTTVQCVPANLNGSATEQPGSTVSLTLYKSCYAQHMMFYFQYQQLVP